MTPIEALKTFAGYAQPVLSKEQASERNEAYQILLDCAIAVEMNECKPN